MPALRLLVRGMAVAGVLALVSAGSAAAVPRPDDDVLPAAPGQHGPNTGHLPPVSKNIELVSKLELTGKFGDVLPEQIADVAVYKGFAYLNSWSTPACDRGGTYVVDIRKPSEPKEVGFLGALADNYHGEGAHVISLDTPQFKGDVLAVNNEWCSGKDPNEGGGMDLWNVTDPTKPELLVDGFGDFANTGKPLRANSSHSVFLWTTGPKAYAVQVDNEETTDVDIFDITNPRSPQPVAEYDLTADPFGSKVWTETANGDTPFHHDVVVKQIGGRWVMLASYWDAGYVQLDVTDPANATYMSDTDFGLQDPLTGFAPPEGNAHQSEYTVGNQYIVTGEEDFAPYRVIDIEVDGVGTFPAAAVGGGAPPEALEDRVLNGPVAYGGYGCPSGSPPVPDADATFPPGDLEPGEEQILILQRGPAGDTNDTYEACFPGEKADVAVAAGWDAVLLVNRHLGSEDDDSPFCGSGAFTQVVVAVCTTHRALHEIFDDPTIDAGDFATPYDDENDVELDGGGVMTIGTESDHKISVEGTFDGWGYMSLYSATPGADGKLPLLDTYAIPEALNPAYAIGYGDLSVHEQAADPTEPLSYSSYYAGGMRVFSVAGGNIAETGAFIDQGGNNFWGVEQFTTSDGERLFAGSDRDFGLYLFRYTGPGAAKRPACTDATVAVPFKGSVTVPLACSDANGNPLTRSIASAPARGTLAAVDNAAGTVTYTHTGATLGTDQFTFTANDGAATSAPATARITVVGASGGGRCFNAIVGTIAAERLTGSRFGDTIRAGAGNDRVRALGGADCVFGEGGRDRLSGDSGNDTLRGGSGKDRLGGGSGKDRLRGGRADDRLAGGTSADRLYGEQGDDRLDAGPGKNRVFGGGGNDRIDAVNGLRDRINCGKGREDSVRADRKDRVSKSCERVKRS